MAADRSRYVRNESEVQPDILEHVTRDPPEASLMTVSRHAIKGTPEQQPGSSQMAKNDENAADPSVYGQVFPVVQIQEETKTGRLKPQKERRRDLPATLDITEALEAEERFEYELAKNAALIDTRDLPAMKKQVSTQFHRKLANQPKRNKRSAGEVAFLMYFNMKRPESICQKFKWQFYKIWAFCCWPLCCPPCPPCIIKKYAFSPPCRKTYDFVQFGPASKNDYRARLTPEADEYQQICRWSYCSLIPLLRCFYVPGTKGRRIASVYCRSGSVFRAYDFRKEPPADKDRKVILYSHTNADDLGILFGRVLELAERFAVDVVAYDYYGYGCSSPGASEKGLYESIEFVYKYMTNEMKIPPSKIIALGSSLGSAATIDLASQFPLCGAVVQGCFLSALRVVCPKKMRRSCLDQFTSLEKVGSITCPTLLIHGEADSVFGIGHMLMMRKRCPGAANLEPLIVKDCEHVEFARFEEYWCRLKLFFHYDVNIPANGAPGTPIGGNQ